MRPGLRRALCAASSLLLAAGCALVRPLPPRLAECPGPLPSTRELPPGDWLLREQARIAGEDVDVGLELVAEKRGDRLVLVAFLPLGAKAFSLVQEEGRVRYESHLGRALPVPPGNVLRDLHAAGLARPGAPERTLVVRPECGYRATYVRVLRRPL